MDELDDGGHDQTRDTPSLYTVSFPGYLALALLEGIEHTQGAAMADVHPPSHLMVLPERVRSADGSTWRGGPTTLPTPTWPEVVHDDSKGSGTS